MGNVAHPIVRRKERNNRSEQIDINGETKRGCRKSISSEIHLSARAQVKEAFTVTLLY